MSAADPQPHDTTRIDWERDQYERADREDMERAVSDSEGVRSDPEALRDAMVNEVRAFVEKALTEAPQGSFDPTYEAGYCDGAREALELVRGHIDMLLAMQNLAARELVVPSPQPETEQT